MLGKAQQIDKKLQRDQRKRVKENKKPCKAHLGIDLDADAS